MQLVALPYSPWSNKAQWALDVAGLDYDVSVYAPMIGEPALRRRIRKSGGGGGRPTVPVLFEEGRPPLTDSLAIARRAAELNPAAGLFPPAHAAGIEAWNTRSETAKRAARALVSQGLGEHPRALLESLPRPLRLPVVGPLIARSGMAFFRRKYGLHGAGEGERGTLRGVLDTWRAALSGRDYVFGTMTYADLAMAVVLHAVEPPAQMVVGEHSRDVWRQPELAADYGDLIAWRDRLIARHPPRWDRLG